jgi:hypothetical protein
VVDASQPLGKDEQLGSCKLRPDLEICLMVYVSLASSV